MHVQQHDQNLLLPNTLWSSWYATVLAIARIVEKNDPNFSKFDTQFWKCIAHFLSCTFYYTWKMVLTFSCLIHYCTLFIAGHHCGSKVREQKILHIPYSVIILLCGILKKHCKHTYIMLTLILTRVEDNQRWWQIQNPMPSPRQNATGQGRIQELKLGGA